MTQEAQTESPLSPTKQALLKIRELKLRLEQAERGGGEENRHRLDGLPLPATVGDPELFWESLARGDDEASEIPANRWDLDAYFDEDPEAPGKMYARKGVFLESLDLLDPEFFGISPREATWVDPQQRLLLEVGWEALERAGWSPDRIGRETGMFVGWMHNDYQNESSDSHLNLNPYIATGSAGSFLCGRLSYYLGLQGPSLAVDTACSSSLVALHLACQSLQRRECQRALVGGVNAIVSPTTNILTCKLRALSPSGHSLAFDARADGYLRGEGCGMVALRRLSDARRDGDPILAVIRGSAINHNGFSSGLTAPNPQAQSQVIRDALQRAGVAAQDIDYLEAHGTGTELGDPIEMRAAAAVLAEDRDERNPLLVGSVKTNIGHLEAAAGMAGLIKVLLALQHEEIPRHLNFEQPNPHIPWDEAAVKVVTEPTPWPNSKPRLAGVSAFGMSGANAHVVIEGPRPEPATADPSDVTRQLLTVSGKSEQAVRQVARNYAAWLTERTDVKLSDLCRTANSGRRHFEQRAALVVASIDDARNRLEQLARSGDDALLIRGEQKRQTRVAWQFTGQGSQYAGMARELYAEHAVFRAAIDDCEARLSELREGSLKDVLFSEPELVHNTHWTQPCLFAVQMGLAQLLESWGCAPDAVLGHSVGQYAAACVAGVMSWADGLRLISERGRLIGGLPAGGAMAAVFASPERIAQLVEDDERLSVAAFNGSHIVISGPEAAIDAAVDACRAEKLRCKRLNTSHAFHSSLMDPALDDFEQAARQIEYRPATLPLICNVSGRVLDVDAAPDAAYWRRHIREPVRYAQSIAALQEMGCDVLLELGPQPVLSGMAAASWSGAAPVFAACLHAERDDTETLLAAAAQVYVRGGGLDLEQLPGGAQGRILNLPTYPFQRRRFWGPPKPTSQTSDVHSAHPLLGDKQALAGLPKEKRYQSWLSTDQPHWLADHRVMDDVVFPGACYVEMGLAASGSPALEELSFELPLRLSGRTCAQTIVHAGGEDGRTTLEIHSSPQPVSHWSKHCTARVAEASGNPPETPDRAAIVARCGETAEPGQFYEMMSGLGLHYGPAFQTIQEFHFNEREVLVRLQLNADVRGYRIPPMLLDGAFHSLAVGLLRDADSSLFLPVGLGAIEVFGTVGAEAWCHAEWKQSEGELRTADLTLFDDHGQVLVRISELRLRQLNRAALRRMSGSGPERLLYEIQWRDAHLTDMNRKPSGWWVVGGGEAATALVDRLQSQEQRCLRIDLARLAGDAECSSAACRIDGGRPEHWRDVLACWNGQTRETATGEHAGNDDEQPRDGSDGAAELALPDGVIWLAAGSCDAAETAEKGYDQTRLQCDGLLGLLQVLREREVKRLDRGLQIVTRAGVRVGDEKVVDAHESKYWGLGRVIGAEQPNLRCRLLDVACLEDDAELLADALLSDSQENQIALRGGQLHVPRLSSCKLETGGSEFQAREDGSYLITGGLGVLGRAAAKWLAAHGAGSVVLVSRREPDEATRGVLDEIEAAGCRVHVHAADIAASGAVPGIMQRFGSGELPPLRGVIHAAGVLDDGLLADQTWQRFDKVLAPKIRGAWALHDQTRECDLDFFVLYSSASSVLGSPGQSNYATANAFLDGLAEQRADAELPGLSINWGPWNEGMADDELVLKRMAMQGITPLTTDEAHAALGKMIQAGVRQATVLDVDWRRMRMGVGGETSPLLAELTPAAAQLPMGDSVLVEKLRKLQPAARKRLLNETVQGDLQEILSTPELPDPDTPLNELGLDSLMAVEFSTRLQQQLGGDFAIAPTLLFDYPTVNALTDYLLELLAELAGPDASDTEVAAVERAEEQDSVAIIGMGCRFPGAEGVEQFWDNLRNGVDAVRDIPEGRWDLERYFDPTPTSGKTYAKAGGFLDDVAGFDADFFGISGAEACWIDPQHRMLLETSWQALENAGVATPLDDSRVGVFMGLMSQDYNQLHIMDDAATVDGFQGAGLSHSAGVGRLSYLFGFEGPSVAIDTASSSSLVAVSQAVKSLLRGECNLALAGGVNAILTPGNSILLSKAMMLSPDGRCRSFSAKANGFGRGEGCGVVVLKRLSEAQRDGDRVLAVVRGSAVCHNGFSGGLTSPSGRAQERVIRDALEDARLRPEDVHYLEAHGTGTEFGDPIEIRAAANVLGRGRPAEEPLLVGSVKANIGHLEAAGGVSGLIKAVLALEHGVIPRQLHFEEPSPHVPWPQLPLKMVEQETDWPETEERVASVSALGMSGTNAHIVLSRAVAAPAEENKEADDSASELLVLSAKSSPALRTLAGRYADFLDARPETRLADLCFTAGVGRRHFEHRAAFTPSTREEASRQLRDFAAAAENGSHSGGRKAAPKIAWLFTDEAGYYSQAGRSLYRSQPAFRETLDQLESAARDAGSPLLERLFGGTGQPTAVALFAIQCGLTNLWRSWGVEPDVVLGTGAGAYAAACLAGVMSVEEGLQLAAARDKLGDADADSLDAFERVADTLDYFPADRPIISDLDGEVVPVHRLLGGSYWRRQCEAPSAVDQSLATLAGLNMDVHLEIGPTTTLLDKLRTAAAEGCAVATMAESDERLTGLEAAADLYRRGVNIDFAALFPGAQRAKLALPSYPFLRRRYWISEVAEHLEENGASETERPAANARSPQD